MKNQSSPSFQIPEFCYKSLFEALPGSCILLQTNAPHYTVLAATPDYLRQTGYRKEVIIGKGVFEMSPANPDDSTDTGASDLENSLEHVLMHKEPHQLPIQRYDIAGENGSFSERYWRASNKPVFSSGGEVAYIIHSADDITEVVKAREREVQLEGIEKAFGLFMHAPIVVGMVDGDDNVLQMANQAAFELWGKGPEIIGKPILEGLPELEGQGVIEIFNQVRTSGQPFIAHEAPVTSFINGNENKHYFNLFYQPYFGNGSKATGVFTISHDVTEQVKGRQKAQESKENYRTLFESMDQAYCTLEILFKEEKCVDFRYLEANPTFERHLGMTNALGKTIREIAPNIEPKWFDFYGGVALTGNPIRIQEESPALNKWFEVYAIRVGRAEERKVGVFFTDITARKEAEEDLNYRTAILEAQNEAIPDAILIVDTKGKMLSFNRHFINLWGIPADIIEQKDDTAALNFAKTQLADPQDFIGRVNDCYLHPNQKAHEDVRFKDGRIIERYGNAVVGEAGRLYGWAWYFRDVTEQRLAEDTLKESEIRFRTLADETPVFIFTIDADPLARVSYWNKTWLTYTGQTYEEALGRAWKGILHVDDIPIVMSHYLPAFNKMEPYFIPAVRVRRSDGQFRWHSFKGNPRYLANGDFNGFVGMGFDIHEQKLTQQQLETALEQARLSKEAAELGTFDLDIEKGDMHWDNRCRTLFSISHNNPVSFDEDFINRLHPDDHDHVEEVVRRTYIKSLSNGDYDIEYRTIGAEDGIVRWVRAKGKVYFDNQEKPVRFIGSVLDITDQVMAIQKIESLVEERTRQLAQVNESLLQANKELQRSNANLEEFTYAASHDLKEPIRKIAIFSNQLKSQLTDRLKENEHYLFSRVQNATERMKSLIDDLLLYSHISHRPHEKESIDLNLKVQGVLEDLDLHIAEKSAIVEVAKLPMVKGYRRQLSQMFQNLISNALKYSRTNFPPHIKISATEVSEYGKLYHLITIKDNGIGFEEQYADKIFQMFTRLHNKAEYSGTGVGLSIVKKVVENHDGFIRVESTLEVGSTFMVLLPAK